MSDHERSVVGCTNKDSNVCSDEVIDFSKYCHTMKIYIVNIYQYVGNILLVRHSSNFGQEGS